MQEKRSRGTSSADSLPLIYFFYAHTVFYSQFPCFECVLWSRAAQWCKKKTSLKKENSCKTQWVVPFKAWIIHVDDIYLIWPCLKSKQRTLATHHTDAVHQRICGSSTPRQCSIKSYPACFLSKRSLSVPISFQTPHFCSEQQCVCRRPPFSGCTRYRLTASSVEGVQGWAR